MDSYRMGGGFRFGRNNPTAGQNHPGGVMTHFYLKDIADTSVVMLEYLESNGKLIKKYASNAKERSEKLEVEKGANRFVWNMRYPNAKDFRGLIMWAGSTRGPAAVPGTYKVRLTVDGNSQEQEFNIIPDPRSTSSIEDMQKQFDFLISVRDKLSETHQAIIDIRSTKSQINQVTDRVKDDESMSDLMDLAKEISKQMTEVEQTLYQTKNQSRQDPLNFPIKLNNKLAHLGSLNGQGDFPPTDQSVAFKNEVTGAIDEQLGKWYEIRDKKIPEFNQKVKEKSVDAIILEKEETSDQ